MSNASLRTEVQSFLETLARAFTRGDGAAVAKLWEVPALVIDQGAVIAVSSLAEVERFFGGAQGQYNEKGIVDTRPELRDLDAIGERLVVAKVRWPYLDASGNTVGAEASDYTLRRDDTGALKVRCVLMRGGQ